MKKLKKVTAVFAVVAVFLSLIAMLSDIQYLKENPFSSTHRLSSPSFVSYSESGSTLVIEKNKTCVTVLGENMEVVNVINGGNRKENSFYYAEFAVLADDSIYLVDMRHTESGSKVIAERIQHFSLSGKLIETLTEYTYSDDNLPRYYGRIASLSIKDGRVFYTYNSENGLSLYEVSEGKRVLLRTLPKIKNDDISHAASYNPVTDAITFTTKKGAVYTEKSGKAVRIDGADNVSALWEAVSDNQGNVFASNITAMTVQRVPQGDTILTPDDSDAGGIYYRLSFSGEKIATTNGTEIFLISTDGSAPYKSEVQTLKDGSVVSVVLNSGKLKLLMIFTWLCAAIVGAALLWLFIKFIIIASKSEQKKSAKIALAAGLIIVITALAVSTFIVSTYQKKVDSKTLDSITQTCKSLSETSGETFGDAFEKINDLDDYGNLDFTFTKKYLDRFCESYYDNGSNLYYLLYKPKDDGILYGVIEYENTIGTVYPAYILDSPDNPGYAEAYNFEKTVITPGDADAYGKWSYAVSPVYNSENKVVGVLEVGTNTYSDELQSKAIVRQVIVTTFAAIVLLLLFVTEIASVSDCVAKYRQIKAHGNEGVVLEFVRPLTLLVFMADGLDGAFLPQLSERLFNASGISFLPEGFAAALPMSLELFAIALSAVVCGVLIDRFKLKRVMLAGACVQLVALVLSAFAVRSDSFILFAMLKLFIGLGMGACIVSGNSLPLCEADSEKRSRLFSGMNIGMMSGIVLGASLGAYVAQHMGYICIYFAAAALMLCAVGVIIAFIGRDTMPEHAQENAQSKSKLSDALKYLLKPKVFTFFVCAMLPFMIMLYFKEFLFPLFADSMNYRESDIGNVILFCGMLPIWLGDILTEQFNKTLGAKRSVLLAFSLYVAALVLFALFETFFVAVIAVVLICIASAFGFSSEMMYYSGLSSQYRINEGTSMGIYSLFDNLGQTLGAPVFGALLVFGFRGSAFTVAAVAAALAIVFSLVSIQRKGDKA